MARAEEVQFQKGPHDGLPSKIVPGTLLVDTTTRNVYLDTLVDGNPTRLWLNETKDVKLQPGQYFEIVNEGDIYNIVKIDGESFTMESPPGNIYFQITKNGVILSEELVKSFQEALNIPTSVEIEMLDYDAEPYGDIIKNVLHLGIPKCCCKDEKPEPEPEPDPPKRDPSDDGNLHDKDADEGVETLNDGHLHLVVDDPITNLNDGYLH